MPHHLVHGDGQHHPAWIDPGYPVAQSIAPLGVGDLFGIAADARGSLQGEPAAAIDLAHGSPAR